MVRPSLLLLHRYAGLTIALFLIISGLTGSLLAFHDEIDEWLNDDWFQIERTSATTPLPLNKLTEIVAKQFPKQTIQFIGLKRESHQSVVMRLTAPDPKDNSDYVDQIFVNPYTGQILGARQMGAFDLSKRGVMPFLFKFHYTLHLPDKWGRWLMGGIALVWLLDSFVGFYLTLPKQTLMNGIRKFQSRWAPAWKIKWGAGASRVNYDAHRASGLWLWGVLFVIAFTSVYFNLNKEVYRPIAGLFTSFTTHPSEALPKIKSSKPPMDWESALARGLQLQPTGAEDLPATYISYLSKQNVFRMSYDEREANAWFKYKREQIFFDANTGELKAVYGHSNGTSGDRFNSWQFPLHTGQMFGLFGRILVLITGLVVAGLSITGVYIWYRKSRRHLTFRPLSLDRQLMKEPHLFHE